MNTYLTVFVAVVVLLCFGSGVLWLLSITWRSLGKQYRAHVLPDGAEFRWQTGCVGEVVYSRMLTIRLCREGIYLAVPAFVGLWCPPLLIPSTRLGPVREDRSVFCIRLAKMEVDLQPITTIRLPASMMETVRSYHLQNKGIANTDHEPFGLGFYEWWTGLSAWLRYGVALLIMILGLILLYCDWGGPYFGGTLAVASIVLFLLAGPSKHE